MAKPARKRSQNLREDCVAEAVAIIAEHGLDKLSLREVARRLGVSHQAPYKHYPSRDHLLAEVLRRAYASFAGFLATRTAGQDGKSAMRAMGKAYIRYALKHPLEYRLMFNTALPDPSDHPGLLIDAHRAFDMLRDALRHRSPDRKPPPTPQDIDAEALFVWSSLHGIVSIMRSDLASSLRITSTDAAATIVLDRIGRAVEAG